VIRLDGTDTSEQHLSQINKYLYNEN
jgi:hypothetical protein